MIPTLIFFLVRRYRQMDPVKARQMMSMIKKTSMGLALILVCIAMAQRVSSQDRKLDYVIKRKGSEVGFVSFNQHSVGTRTVFKLESEVKTRFVFLFTAKGEEEAVYENGILVSSRIFRKMNGNEKANKRTRLEGSNYRIINGKKTELMSSYPICYSMLSLYTTEPMRIGKVYSDNFQAFLVIQTLAPHHYRIDFPDGNYNEYFYRNGICTKVNIHHSLYSASIELKS